MRPAFHLTRSLLLAFAMVLMAACDAETEVDQQAVTTPEIEEIPVTTSSSQALAEFEAGLRALDVGRPREAYERFLAAVAEDPEFVSAYLGAANSSASAVEYKRNLDLAIQHADGASEGEKMLVEINQTFFTNDAERRTELAERLVESYPNSPRAWLTLGDTKGDLNQNEAAREALSKAVELAPELLAGHRALWSSYLFSEPKSFERAREAIQRCIELAPEEAKCHEGLGDVYRAMNDLDQARELYTRATEHDPELVVAQIKKGHIESFLGDFEAARAAYDAGLATATGTDGPVYANYRAFTHLHGDDPRAALDELQGIVDSIGGLDLPRERVAGVLETTYENMAWIALHHGFLDEAEDILEAAAAVQATEAAELNDPDFTRQGEANNLFWEAQLAARRGDFDRAEAAAEEHRALLEGDDNPRRFEQYHALIGLIAVLGEDFPRAIEHLEKSTLAMIYVKYYLGLAHEGAGDQDQARKLFHEVTEWKFNTVDAALVRRDALQRAAS